jgi:hypothetical protein
VVTLHIVVLEQGGYDYTFVWTGVNKFRVAKVNTHMIHYLLLERDEEDEVPWSQIGAGDRAATTGLVLGGARKGYPGHCQVHLRGQTGTVYAGPIQTAFAIFHPQPTIGLRFPGSRGYRFPKLRRREVRHLGFTAVSAWPGWWIGLRRALATNEQEGGCHES